jgi:hypothetical protein
MARTAGKFAIWAAAQRGAEKLDCKIEICNLQLLTGCDFGRTKPNCAVLSMDPEKAEQLLQQEEVESPV